jgi:hypothetical protein
MTYAGPDQQRCCVDNIIRSPVLVYLKGQYVTPSRPPDSSVIAFIFVIRAFLAESDNIQDGSS